MGKRVKAVVMKLSAQMVKVRGIVLLIHQVAAPCSGAWTRFAVSGSWRYLFKSGFYFKVL